MKRFYERDGEVLGTRASFAEQFLLVKEEVPEIEYDAVSRILKVEKKGQGKKGLRGGVYRWDRGYSGGGGSCPDGRIFRLRGWIGSMMWAWRGIHRLLSQRERLMKANCIIAVAGMEGALGTVVAGLVDCPVIAVPTSVGYGANFHGVSALLTMLNSCANGISVVNIDNGYGAGYLATQINRLAVK